MGQTILTARLSLMSGKTTTPVEFLDYARRIVIKGDTMALINSLSNVKCAIDCQLDVILEMYGLLKLSKKEKWAFPKKNEIIQKIGIVSLNILNLINSKRNALEHHYEKPDKKQVMEFIDIAELFIELFKSRHHRIELFIDPDDDFAFWMDLENNTIHIYDNTKLFLDIGGIHMFMETVKEKNIQTIQTISISDIEAWSDACNRYIKR